MSSARYDYAALNNLVTPERLFNLPLLDEEQVSLQLAKDIIRNLFTINGKSLNSTDLYSIAESIVSQPNNIEIRDAFRNELRSVLIDNGFSKEQAKQFMTYYSQSVTYGTKKLIDLLNAVEDKDIQFDQNKMENDFSITNDQVFLTTTQRGGLFIQQNGSRTHHLTGELTASFELSDGGFVFQEYQAYGDIAEKMNALFNNQLIPFILRISDYQLGNRTNVIDQWVDQMIMDGFTVDEEHLPKSGYGLPIDTFVILRKLRFILEKYLETADNEQSSMRFEFITRLYGVALQQYSKTTAGYDSVITQHFNAYISRLKDHLPQELIGSKVFNDKLKELHDRVSFYKKMMEISHDKDIFNIYDKDLKRDQLSYISNVFRLDVRAGDAVYEGLSIYKSIWLAAVKKQVITALKNGSFFPSGQARDELISYVDGLQLSEQTNRDITNILMPMLECIVDGHPKRILDLYTDEKMGPGLADKLSQFQMESKKNKIFKAIEHIRKVTVSELSEYLNIKNTYQDPIQAEKLTNNIVSDAIITLCKIISESKGADSDVDMIRSVITENGIQLTEVMPVVSLLLDHVDENAQATLNQLQTVLMRMNDTLNPEEMKSQLMNKVKSYDEEMRVIIEELRGECDRYSQYLYDVIRSQSNNWNLFVSGDVALTKQKSEAILNVSQTLNSPGTDAEKIANFKKKLDDKSDIIEKSRESDTVSALKGWTRIVGSAIGWQPAWKSQGSEVSDNLNTILAKIDDLKERSAQAQFAQPESARSQSVFSKP